jgi:cephalosporin-C deacetylase-like acetyl esterase
MLRRASWCLLLCWLSTAEAQTPPASAPANDPYPEWSVFYGAAEFEAPGSMLSRHLEKVAAGQTAARHALIGSLTAGSVEDYRAKTRARLRAVVGAFPARTPLRAVTTGTLEREGYRVEKVVFESRPQYYVTADVYVPRGPQGPFPAVLCPVGHWGSGKYLEDYQRLGMWLARHGFVTLVYDGPGQGERLQYFDSVLGHSLVDPGSSEFFVTIEHWLTACPNILAADNYLSYILWDGVRGLDYLASRQDVDGNRMACTGVSGGGLQVELLAALDERIKVAIPVCYGGCAMETPTRPDLSAADVDVLIAPRPLLMIEATGDDRRTVLEKRERHGVVSRYYGLLGAGERTRFLIADGPHGYVASMRAEAAAWLNRWLGGARSPVPEIQEASNALESAAALRCTATGQVSSALGGESVLSLSRTDLHAVRFPERLPASREEWSSWRRALVEKVSKRIDYTPPQAPLDAKILTHVDKGSYVLEKIAYSGAPGIFVPGLLFLPKSAGAHAGVVFINEDGKSSGEVVRDYLEPLVAAEFVVLSIDPSGMGETAPANSPSQHNYRGMTNEAETDYFHLARFTGTTVTGIRTADVVRGVDYLETRPEIDRRRISAIGHGAGGLLALYAAALDQRLASAISNRGLVSYAEMIEGELYAQRFGIIVPGVLRDFDLPELCATIAPRPLLLMNSVDERLRRVDSRTLEQKYRPTIQVYGLAGAGRSLNLEQTAWAAEAVAAYVQQLRR